METLQQQIDNIKAIIANRAQILGFRFNPEEIISIPLNDEVIAVFLRSIEKVEYNTNEDGTIDVTIVNEPIIYIEYQNIFNRVNIKKQCLEIGFNPPKIHILYPELIYTIRNFSVV